MAKHARQLRGSAEPVELPQALACYQRGDLTAALQLAQQGLLRNPQHLGLMKVAGAAAYGVGNLAAAETYWRIAIQLQPHGADMYNNLGVLLKDTGRFVEAEACCRQALQLNPQFVEAHYNLGNVLKDLDRLTEAEACYRQALQFNPQFADAHNNLGNLLKDADRLTEAEASYRQALQINPQYVSAHNNLGNLLKDTYRLAEAEVSYRQALQLNQQYAQSHNNLGMLLKDLLRQPEAQVCYRQALALALASGEAQTAAALQADSQYWLIYDNLLFTMNYDERLSAAELFSAYQAYEAAVQAAVLPRFAHHNHPAVQGRRIRIGYSSPDFRGHACRYFMEPMLRHHDRRRFELFAYAQVTDPDAHTERLQGYFDHWLDVRWLSDEVLAQRIYDDQLDILVDLAGHTRGNRLLVLARRPAPVQVSCLGSGYTTGLSVIDYFMGDEHLTPEGCEAYFSERIWRLAAPYYVYDPPRELTPAVSELPALRNGFVTFGSLARTVRLNEPLLRAWQRILVQVPGSRLRLDQKTFLDAATRESFWQRLEQLGIARERVDLTCSQPHWTAYHAIDISLDCWPHNVGTTAFESLWMGVPVLTKRDRPSVGRIGAAILLPLGLDAWVVDEERDYIARAVAAAADLQGLVQLRASLRGRLEQSPLLDGAGLMQKWEAAYLQMLTHYEASGQ